MVFRFYTKQVSQATRGRAAVVFITGMLLVAGAMLIVALPKLFGYLMAAVFALIGLSVIGYAVRLFVAASNMDKNAANSVTPSDELGGGNTPEVYRKNVQVHVRDSDQNQQES